MILVGSQRAGASQLAAHLLNDRDNDHVELYELRDFMSDNLRDALGEAHAVSLGTKCKQFMFSLSINPPKDGTASVEDMLAAADRAEEALGLKGLPRAVVVHEKKGRRHIHVVWSRIDAETMRAVNLPFFKTELKALSRELYLEHGWELPEGHRTNGWRNPMNFTLAEWQQARRLDLDPREVKQVIQDAWQRSDSLAGLSNALEERGYYLAKGDRRGVVVLDRRGEVFSLSRWAGVRTKDVEERLGAGAKSLPSVDEKTAQLKERLAGRLNDVLTASREEQAEERKPLEAARRAMVQAQRRERSLLAAKQEQRWKAEGQARAARTRTGIRGAFDVLIGRAAAIRRQNEREAWQAHLRDRDQREAIFEAQTRERRALQARMDALAMRQRDEREALSATIARMIAPKELERAPTRRRRRNNDFSMEP